VKKAQLNLIDKAVAFLNPQGAVNRMIARQKLVNFSYDAVKYTRERKGPSSLSGAEDYRSNYDRVELMKRARDLAENVGLVRSILMKFASHTAANVSYQARTENPEVNTEVEAYWAEWWDKCDLTTRHTGSTLMQVAMMSMLRDGDFLIVLVRDKDGNLKIQGIEADRLGDPFKVYTSLDLIGGIHIDRDTGAPSAYDIYNRSIGDFYTYQATIPSSQAFHLFDPLRIDQYRGISAFHTAINDATDIYDIINFEKMAAKNASSQAGIVKRNNNNASDLSSLTNDEDLNGNTIKLEAIESGKISYLEPGEDIIFPDGPSRPSGAFAEFHKILLRNICLGLGIPYSFAVDPSAMSGPTARLEMQQAGRTFRRYQKLLDDKVLRPIKNIVIADAVSRGLIENNVGTRTTKGIFNFGANVSIDLGRESQANLSEFRAGLMTASQIYSERGLDFESSMRQRAIEAKLIKDLASEYEVSADTISDIAAEGLTRDSQQAQVTTPEGEQKPAGQPSDEDMLGGASLNGAQVASLINVINAVAMGAVSKEGAVSIITAAFPTISPDQARAIVAGVNIGTTIPTTKEEKQQITKDQGGDTSGGSTPQEPTPTPPAPQGTTQKKSNLEILESLDPASIKMLIEGMMGGIELAKYDGIDFTPPQGARDAAKRALDVRETKPPSQRGMTPVGLARARDLQNGVKMSPDTIKRMKAFFDRHEVDKKGSTFGEQGKGWQAWNGWGGDAGYAWARKVVGQMEARDKKTEFVAGRDCGQDEGGTFGPDNKCAVGYGRPPFKGGYTPTRPGGKIPSDYKRPTPQDKGSEAKQPKEPKEPSKPKASSDGHTYDKDGNIVIPKYQLSDMQKAGKRPIPSKGAKLFNGKADARDWNQYRSSQLKADPEAVWKVGEVKIKGENLDFKTWNERISNDVASHQVKDDFKGDQYFKINTTPESKTSQTLLKVFGKQAPHKQKEDMWRGLAFETKEETDNFIKGISGGMALNRTLTSFSPDQNVASKFTAGAKGGNLYLRLTKSKSLRQFDASKSLGEREFVLPYKSRIRMVGQPKQVQYRKNGPFSTVVDVEEY
jgi:lambda family phage portal protein